MEDKKMTDYELIANYSDAIWGEGEVVETALASAKNEKVNRIQSDLAKISASSEKSLELAKLFGARLIAAFCIGLGFGCLFGAILSLLIR